MVLVTSDRFAALVQALGLSQSFFKPLAFITTNAINSTERSELPAVNASSSLGHDIPSILLHTVNNVHTLGQRDNSCAVDPYDENDIDDQTFARFDQTEANIYRYRQQQSVNLGSW
jgi:hypothetical protein